MSARKRVEQGFTLVEILIVVVILGILAAIVIPQFTNAGEAARASNLVSQLQSIRSQLELYQIQHAGAYPDLTVAPTGASDPADPNAIWEWLTQPTDINGNVVAVGTPGSFGPYLQKPPLNPFTAGTAGTLVKDSGVAVDGTEGWHYNTVTGEIRASLLQTKADELNLNYNAIGGDISEY